MAGQPQRIAILLSLLALAAGKPSRRIVGGEEANPHEFPYQISLQWNFNIEGLRQPPMHFCGGSLIAERFILTAGHCVPNYSPDGFVEAVAGAHDFTQYDGAEQRRRVVERFIHEDYAGGVNPNDIAVFRVDRPFVLNRNVQLISLPVAGAIPTGMCTISGWGSTSFTTSPIYPDILMKTSIPVMDLDKCRSIYFEEVIEDSNVCAGTIEGTSSVCSGDSGGPLVQTTDDGSYVQVGTVSWGGIPCGGWKKPGVFVRVSHFIDWINDKVNN